MLLLGITGSLKQSHVYIAKKDQYLALKSSKKHVQFWWEMLCACIPIRKNIGDKLKSKLHNQSNKWDN